jgi:hypothetical protein
MSFFEPASGIPLTAADASAHEAVLELISVSVALAEREAAMNVVKPDIALAEREAAMNVAKQAALAERNASMNAAQQDGSNYVSVELSKGLRGRMYEAMSDDEARTRQHAAEMIDSALGTLGVKGWELVAGSRAIMHEGMANYAQRLGSDHEAIRQIRDFLDQWELRTV